MFSLIYTFLVVLYVCVTWSLTLREEYIFRVFENRVLKKNFERRERKWKEAVEDFIMRSFITFTFHQVLLG
jgi:hypothetical protein